MPRSSQNKSTHHHIPLQRALFAAVLLITSAGCPPRPPSQEAQRQASMSRWITVEASPGQLAAEPVLSKATFDAIVSSAPTIIAAFPERVRMGMLSADGNEAKARVSTTTSDYLALLKVGARVEVQKGRFIEATDTANAQSTIVITNALASKLFPNADPLGKLVNFEGITRTVVGVVTDGAQWGEEVKRDAFVPLMIGGTDDKSNTFDRIRLHVGSIDQVEDTQAVVRNVVEARHPDQDIHVRSVLSAR